ncbi:MAG: HU family DNA-binding protein, partial [Phascolarctobacterium sp.]|nr:HU family DNA-binding protein [Candidatus Phascolarctobacterium equi]
MNMGFESTMKIANIKLHEEEFLMNKTELVEAIAKKAELSKKDAGIALQAVIDTVI